MSDQVLVKVYWAVALCTIGLMGFSVASPGLAADAFDTRTGAWRMTGVLAAPEAVQAAAAYGPFVYAISSTHVAKYDRQSGQRIAVSQGEAQHLNSGFFWKGRLYCAHSNYPKQPEQSQVKVLDVESMQLTKFHDFQDFGGSLTWVILSGDHWWCNFAHYGDANHKTFLVKFDNDWRELARWTYPDSIIRQLGRYSLSGGIWHDGELLVTGHDDPVLLRVALPEQGSVLVDKGRQPAPFTGQGIADDPATGGLVGINRAKQQVVFASDPKWRLRLLTYNIHHGEGVDGKLDLERIASVIRSVEPDVVALQEVDRKVKRTKFVDQPEELSRPTKMHVVFGDNIPLQGGHYGNAVLSRFPIRVSRNHRLPRLDEGEQRGVLEVELDWPASSPDRSNVRVLATHLDHRPDERERVASVRVMNELIQANPLQPALLMGDLNAVPDSTPLKELQSHWTRANDQPVPTIPVEKPKHQIDYILLRPTSRWKVLETRALDEAVASDHRAFLTVVEFVGVDNAR
ncbi:MAG: endonuclease/exonuclease/phosphatase family protein [Planctomycetaceae bacterium]